MEKIKKKAKLYEGKAKIVYSTNDPNLIIQYFKDDATAFNAQKRGTIQGKGVVNNLIASTLFEYLESHGVPTHFVARLSEREMLCRKLAIVPVETVVRNVIAGGLAARYGLPEGGPLKTPVLEYSYKHDQLGDPWINEWHLLAFGWATKKQIARIEELAFEINKLLKKFFAKRNIILVDFKLEFGMHKGKLLLGDEISPDTCRFWDAKTKEKLDKDRFRRDLGDVEAAYEEMRKRVLGK